jgi:hypothetical protein
MWDFKQGLNTSSSAGWDCRWDMLHSAGHSPAAVAYMFGIRHVFSLLHLSLHLTSATWIQSTPILLIQDLIAHYIVTYTLLHLDLANVFFPFKFFSSLNFVHFYHVLCLLCALPIKLTLEPAMKAQKGYSCTLSLNSALDGMGGQCHTPAALPPGKTQYP